MNSLNKFLLALIFIASLALSAKAGGSSATLSLDGKPALALTVPADAKVTSSNAFVKIKTTNCTGYIWLVPGAKTVAKAESQAGEIIRSEFVKFKVTGSMDMEVGGMPGKHITGSGNEADDGDPGNAEVIVFKAGPHVFAACIHGEADEAARERGPFLAILATAHALEQ